MKYFFIVLILIPLFSLATQPKILNVRAKSVVASTTDKGNIKTVFNKMGGLWKGKRAAPKQAAQASSDNLKIELEAPGVAIESVNIYPCQGHGLSGPIKVQFTMQISGKIETLKAAECKTYECFSLNGNQTAVQSIWIDFKDNQKVCLKNIALFSTGGELINLKFNK